MGMEFPETAVKADDSCCAFDADSGVATLKQPAIFLLQINPSLSTDAWSTTARRICVGWRARLRQECL